MTCTHDKDVILRILNEISEEKFYKSYISNITRMRGRRFNGEMLLDYAFHYKGVLYNLDVEIIDDERYIYKLSCEETQLKAEREIIKTTEFISRIDDLGRICIPRAIREKIFGGSPAYGESMNVFIDGDSIVLKPYKNAEQVD